MCGMCLQHHACIQSVTVVLDEDVGHQITLTREGEVIIGVNPAPALPYVDGRNRKSFESELLKKMASLCSKKEWFLIYTFLMVISFLTMSFVVCFWVYRYSGGAEAYLCVYSAKGRDWSEAAL